MKEEAIYNSFPARLRADVAQIITLLPVEKTVLHASGASTLLSDTLTENVRAVTVGNELLKIPYRIYLDEPASLIEEQLTATQITILNCLYTRHQDGFVRQRRLPRLLHATDSFVIPFKLQLLGEYVIEIVFELDKHINDQTIGSYREFIRQNEYFWNQTQRRVVSYWNEYYRSIHFPYKNYIGKQLIERLVKKDS